MAPGSGNGLLSCLKKTGAKKGNGESMKAFLMLEDGTLFEGRGFGTCRDTLCEVVFNTGMCGYTELLTDPSYAGQGVVMTYPLMGSYGICYEDAESSRPWLKAFIVRSLIPCGSNFRKDVDLEDYLNYHGIPGMECPDTRALTKHLRERGTMRGKLVYGESLDKEETLRQIKKYKLVSQVPIVSSPERPFLKGNGCKIALMDFGVKENIIRSLTKRGCSVQSFPYNASFEEIKSFSPDGVMLTNGPGDPQECGGAIEEIKKLMVWGVPIFAICLGHQLMALASGANTYRLKYGHRGINHPVKDLAENRVYITSQNHGYVVDASTVDPKTAEISFKSMNDGSVEGLTYSKSRAFSVQFHPEASPGPQDTGFLFDRFITMMGGKHI